MKSIRVDKWLWSVRIVKTRTLAGKLCDRGRVQRGDDKLKASSKIQVGDQLKIRIDHRVRHVTVNELIEKRVGAAIAQNCFDDLDPTWNDRIPSDGFGIPFEQRPRGSGRPTKKERRDIDGLKELGGES